MKKPQTSLMTGTYLLPDGLAMRPMRIADLQAAVDLFNISAREIVGVDKFVLEDIANEWQNTPNWNLAESTRGIFTPSGELVAYEEVWAHRTPPTNINIWGRVHPDYEGRGIGSTLVAWAEHQARQAIPRAPEGTKVAIFCGNINTHTPSTELMVGSGMKLVRHFIEMRIAIDPSVEYVAVWPEGLTVRPYRHPEDAFAVYTAVQESFRDHWGYVPEPPEFGFQRWSSMWFKSGHFDPELWYLAMDGDKIAGFCLNRSTASDSPVTGYVGSLGVLRPYRKLGLGLALLQHSFEAFRDLGRAYVSLHVDGENLTGAMRLYHKAGMDIYRQFDTYEKVLRPGVDLSTQSLT